MRNYSRLTAHRSEFIHPKKAQTLGDHLCVEDFDLAMDGAARRSHATVAQYLVAPLELHGPAHQTSLNLPLNFLSHPQRLKLLPIIWIPTCGKRSAGYAAGRDDGRYGSLILHIVPSGTFHQWRMSWNGLQLMAPLKKWSSDRSLLESLLWQVRMGWND